MSDSDFDSSDSDAGSVSEGPGARVVVAPPGDGASVKDLQAVSSSILNRITSSILTHIL